MATVRWHNMMRTVLAQCSLHSYHAIQSNGMKWHNVLEVKPCFIGIFSTTRRNKDSKVAHLVFEQTLSGCSGGAVWNSLNSLLAPIKTLSSNQHKTAPSPQLSNLESSMMPFIVQRQGHFRWEEIHCHNSMGTSRSFCVYPPILSTSEKNRCCRLLLVDHKPNIVTGTTTCMEWIFTTVNIWHLVNKNLSCLSGDAKDLWKREFIDTGALLWDV